ncbi:unnamed protein product [Amoebophrya sp. A25]|nr:unnamed protein product [Amoebophrya sp. A25]|eukprot:GSA25T00003346001.1
MPQPTAKEVAEFMAQFEVGGGKKAKSLNDGPLTDTQVKFKKAVYSGHTLVGPWDDKRMAPEYQHDARMRKLYQLPGKIGDWSTTSGDYGHFAERDMRDKLTRIRNIGTYKRDDLGDPAEYYKSSQRTHFADPGGVEMPHFDVGLPEEFVEEYATTWSKTDPYMHRFDSKYAGAWSDMAVDKLRREGKLEEGDPAKGL